MVPEPTGVAALDVLLVWGGAFSFAVAVFTGLWRAGRAVAVFCSRLSRFLDDWYGEPARPGFPARPGVLERVASIEGQVGAFDRRMTGVEYELRENGGASLRDAVNRINCRLDSIYPDSGGPCARPQLPPES